MKSLHSASGSGVRTYDAGCISGAATKVVYQKRLAGRSASALYVANQGGVQLLGATEQLFANPDRLHPFRCDGNIAPLPESPADLQCQLERIGKVLHENLTLSGPFGVDFVLCEGRAYPVEINPRWTAANEVLEFASGLNLFALASGDLPARQKPPYVARSIVFAEQGMQTDHEFTLWSLNHRGKLTRPLIADIPSPSTIMRQGDPVCTVFAYAASLQAVRQQLSEARGNILNQLSRLPAPSPSASF
jgi:predicted ATP-grasp superfamily ATP-dependent carboligase